MQIKYSEIIYNFIGFYLISLIISLIFYFTLRFFDYQIEKSIIFLFALILTLPLMIFTLNKNDYVKQM